MKLKEKFKELGSEWCFEISDFQAKEAEILADEFAVGFVRWLDARDFDGKTYEELLEIYKKIQK
jgi:hypothetical protein